MRSIELRLFAAISFLLVFMRLVLASPLHAAAHPKYGGTLRVELNAASVSLDPRAWQSGELEFATNEKLAALMFERLVALDNYGRFQPVLATEWSHDASNKRWQFAIRAGVRFSDGSAWRITRDGLPRVRYSVSSSTAPWRPMDHPLSRFLSPRPADPPTSIFRGRCER